MRSCLESGNAVAPEIQQKVNRISVHGDNLKELWLCLSENWFVVLKFTQTLIPKSINLNTAYHHWFWTHPLNQNPWHVFLANIRSLTTGAQPGPTNVLFTNKLGKVD